MEHRKDKTSAVRQTIEDLTAQKPKIAQMLTNQGTEHSVEEVPTHRKRAVQIRLREWYRRVLSPCNLQHTPGEVETKRRAAGAEHQTQMRTSAASRIQHALAQSGSQQVQRMAPVEGDKRVLCLIIALGPAVVSLTNV